MNRRAFLGSAAVALGALTLSRSLPAAQPPRKKPNIVFILADDLGYGSVGCFGQQKIKTPCVDKMAAEGVRLTQAYAGCTVCSPSRGVLMTGFHMGHSRIRGNHCFVGGIEGRLGLSDEDRTVAQMLRDAGYHTGHFGKWHLDGNNPKAMPLDRGFDETCNTNGYFPTKHTRNSEVIDIKANQGGKQAVFGPDLLTDDAVDFITRHKDQPFFLYYAFNLPHSPYQAPSLDQYAGLDWTENAKTYACMITCMDRCVGRILDHLTQSGLDENTIVFFTSDNGGRSEDQDWQTETVEFFDVGGPLKGYKRDLYEGGIREPTVVRWPGRIKPGATSDAVFYFADFMPTCAELAGARATSGIDGISVLPALLGKPQDTADRYLYWEFYERGFQQAARWRNWKAIRQAPGLPLEIYDLAADLGEEKNIAADHPDIVRQFEDYLKSAHVTSPNWPLDIAAKRAAAKAKETNSKTAAPKKKQGKKKSN